MFAPGVSQVVHDFHVNSVELSSFVVSVYLLGYCFGPLLIAPVSEIVGRRVVYNSCNFLYVVFTITCAVAPNMGSLTFFRFLAGFAGSCPLTIGAGSIADMYVQEHRGGAMAAWALGPLIGPVAGPVAGGYLSQAKGWRWTFWVLAMASGLIFVLSLFTIRESYAPTLLAAKTKKLQKETGNQNLRSVYDTGRKPMDLFMFSIVRPTKMLFLSPIVFLLSLYVGIIYGYLYLLFTTISAVFEGQYGWSQGSVGLSYLGIGIGSFIGLFILGGTSDKLLHHLAVKKGGMKPEYRLPPMIPGSVFVPISLFIYGWSAYYKTHWIVPIIGTSFLGIGMLISFVSFPIPTGGSSPMVIPFSSFLFAILLTRYPPMLDGRQHLSCRCLHHLCCFCHGCQHRVPITSRCTPPSRRPQNVRATRPWLGELPAWLHFLGHVPAANPLLHIWRAYPNQQAVPSGLLIREHASWANSICNLFI